jgi:hypothetical protein
MENGERKMENEKRKMKNGIWEEKKKGNGKKET